MLALLADGLAGCINNFDEVCSVFLMRRLRGAADAVDVHALERFTLGVVLLHNLSTSKVLSRIIRLSAIMSKLHSL